MKPKVLLLGVELDPWLLFAARALQDCGVCFKLACLPPTERILDADEKDCRKWLSQCNEIEVHSINDEVIRSFQADIALCCARGNITNKNKNTISSLIKNANRKLVLLRFWPKDSFFNIKQCIKEIRDPFLKKFNEIWTEDSDVQIISRLLQKHHRYFGILPSQRCSASSTISTQLCGSQNIDSRKFLFNYAGTENAARILICKSLEAYLESKPDKASGIYTFSIDGKAFDVMWFNDKPDTSRSRDYSEYLKMLDNSDFTLCLPGYTGTTNRVLESICRLSIPVLPAETVKYYDLPLINGFNSVLVKNQDWLGSVKQILTLTHSEKINIRENVCKLAHDKASLSSLKNRLTNNILNVNN